MKASPLTIGDVLRTLRDQVATWAGARGCRLETAGSAWHVLSLLSAAPAGLMALVWWGGDEAAGGRGRLARHTLHVVLGRNRGLGADPSAHLVEDGPTGRRALFDLVEELRSHVMGHAWPEDITEGPRYAGCEPFVTPDGDPLDAYQISIALVAEMPAPARIDQPAT